MERFDCCDGYPLAASQRLNLQKYNNGIQFSSLSDWKMTKKPKCQLNLTVVLLNSNLVILIRVDWDGRRIGDGRRPTLNH